MLVRNSIFSTKLFVPSKIREYIGNSPKEVLFFFGEEPFSDALATVLEERFGYTAGIFEFDSFSSLESTVVDGL